MERSSKLVGAGAGAERFNQKLLHECWEGRLRRPWWAPFKPKFIGESKASRDFNIMEGCRVNGCGTERITCQVGAQLALWDQVLPLSSLHRFHARVALKESLISWANFSGCRFLSTRRTKWEYTACKCWKGDFNLRFVAMESLLWSLYPFGILQMLPWPTAAHVVTLMFLKKN